MASELSQAEAAHSTLQTSEGDSIQRALSVVPDDLRALQAVVVGTAGVGREFFRCLVRHLAEAIDAQYAAACEFLAPPKGRVLAFWERDHVVEDLDFDFITSPAAEVLKKEFVHIPTGVLQRFPKAGFLAERNIEGYMAVPFVNSKGDAIGLLSVFDERPMPAEPRRLFIMQIFAARAAAEFERLRADQRLQESEARYRDLYENAPNAYWLVSTEGRVISANHRAGELLGYPLEEIISARTVSFGADTPAGKPRILEVRRKHLAGESVAGVELELRRKDGQPAWIKVWMVPGRDANGAIGAARAFGIDVTDRVVAETERARLQEQNFYLREEINAEHNFEQIIGRSSAFS